ncbi:Glycosyl transferase family 2 [Pseudarcicella hirudinis]|uniref:Glycosyl transferase family 2 n=3 Tax=Pseudarcicella hirudinis TaxID=1079859 RepID=A0A1I5YMP4_9BACT|nr:glycosyltransferase family 2 protein [Pseudarcicella hirudinis]SFQ45390.1 Glycosyl transferase family 2 [Pseudarcicella hirudinis]
MSFFKNPSWISQHTYSYKNVDDVPEREYSQINQKLAQFKQSENPEVSVVIAAWNEEVNLLPTIGSLADSVTEIPFEILVVNNNSTDRTQEVLDKLNIRSCIQTIQGCGPARQMGLEQAKGKYILSADADCIYPPLWIEKMVKALRPEDVACVYGRYSFIANDVTPRWKLSIYETLKDVMAEIRQVKRPYLNTLGMTMGYRTADALKVGYVMTNVRGEDGRLTFDLMPMGKVVQVKDRDARVWTGTRTLDKDGSFFKMVSIRIVKEIKRIFEYFKPLAPHDTKTSKS